MHILSLFVQKYPYVYSCSGYQHTPPPDCIISKCEREEVREGGQGGEKELNRRREKRERTREVPRASDQI